MMLMATLRRPLESKYGPGGYLQLREALDNFAEVTQSRMVALDDSADMGAAGLMPAPSADANAVLAGIRSLRSSLSPSPDSLMLVGGDDIVPFWQITNPVTDRGIDPDRIVLTDNPYGAESSTLQEYLAPPLAVGRLADFSNASTDDFLAIVKNATANREAPPARSGAVAVINSEWLEFSRSVTAVIPYQVEWHFAPGYLLDGGSQPDRGLR